MGGWVGWSWATGIGGLVGRLGTRVGRGRGWADWRFAGWDRAAGWHNGVGAEIQRWDRTVGTRRLGCCDLAERLIGRCGWAAGVVETGLSDWDLVAGLG